MLNKNTLIDNFQKPYLQDKKKTRESEILFKNYTGNLSTI